MLIVLVLSALAAGMASLVLSILAGQPMIVALGLYTLAGCCGITACALHLHAVRDDRGGPV